jgi:polyferredoxin
MALRPRIKTLRALPSQPHRYLQLRRLTQSLTIAVLVLVPASGVARFDAWRAGHLAWGRPTDPFMAFGWVAIAIVAFYFVTFLLNAVLGRVFCGFGCPVGQASRLADGVNAAKGRRAVLRAVASQLLYALAFAGAALSWWVDPRVLWAGTLGERAATLGVWLALAALVVAHGRYWRWRFCQSWCPIGVYYSAVQTEHSFGIHFQPTDCEGCNLCEAACPVELNPKSLTSKIPERGGISMAEFPAAHHCLSCGDCVRACEHATRRRPDQLVPLRLGFGKDPQREPLVSPE